MLDEVSMTKITSGPDHAAVTAEVLEVDQRGPVDLEPVAPLDHDRATLRELFQPEVAQVRAALDPVEVDVGELHAAGVDTDELKRGARNVRFRTGALGEAPHERGLPRAQLAGEQDDIAGAQALAQQQPGPLGLSR